MSLAVNQGRKFGRNLAVPSFHPAFDFFHSRCHQLFTPLEVDSSTHSVNGLGCMARIREASISSSGSWNSETSLRWQIEGVVPRAMPVNCAPCWIETAESWFP